MAKISAKDATILISGYSLSTLFTSFEAKMGVGQIEVTGFGDGSHNYIPGIHAGAINMDGIWDKDANKTVDVLGALGAGHVTIIPVTYSLGCSSLSMPYNQSNFAPAGSSSSAIQIGKIDFQLIGARSFVEYGRMLAHQTITATLTGSSNRDIGQADLTTCESSGTLHIWDSCPSDTYEVKIQHSTDGSSGWTDLITFTLDGSTIGSERIVVAAGALKQYRRVVATRTGSAGDNFGFSVHFWRDPLGV